MQSIQPECLEITVLGRTRYVSIIRVITFTIAKIRGFSEDKANDFVMAVGEACVNSIRHGYESKIGEIVLRYLVYPDRLCIVVKDMGKGFDPKFARQYMKRRDAERPERMGMGLTLIAKVMDEVEYDSKPFSGTLVRMTKYRADRQTDGDQKGTRLDDPT